MKRALIATVLTIGLFFAVFLSGMAVFARMPLSFQKQTVIFEVPKGASVQTLVKQLRREGIVSAWQATLLRYWIRWEGKMRSLQAGEYAIPRNITPRALLKKWVKGDVIYHAVTFSEGITFKEALKRLENHPALLKVPLTTTDILSELGQKDFAAEGWFFPATYYFKRNAHPISVLKQAYEKMQTQLDTMYAGRSEYCVLKSPYEVLIMASIIEKETALEQERALISGVLQRRLAKNMLLQADPTLIYGLKEKFSDRLTTIDLGSNNPYNTYVHKGLPPTPIALPSESALRAACHPEPGVALYFVSKGDGSHHFSESLSEHQAAVKKYQLKSKGAL